ncbi:MAG: chitobiase/beta-hexosaminidase C-terminal domain-containing protein [Actinomycetota bacterium]|nr:chitobiase/beta-hexosaminidase C-terminal domain-containing protein [Actinomycetota bacterium]
MRLSATDNTGGSGVDKTYYTTDGSTPTTASPVYTGPFSVSGTTTVQFFSTDLAGNQEQVKSQLIRIDQAAPTVTLTRPQAGASFKKGSKVMVAADTADLGSGSAASGVASVTFYVDGTAVLGTVSVSPYQLSWNTGSVPRGIHTLTAVARDVAGNSSTSAAVAVKIT